MEDVEVSFWRDRKVFVTGATGLPGSWLVESLLAREAQVVCLIRDQVPMSRLVGEGLNQQFAPQPVGASNATHNHVFCVGHLLCGRGLLHRHRGGDPLRANARLVSLLQDSSSPQQ